MGTLVREVVTVATTKGAETYVRGRDVRQVWGDLRGALVDDERLPLLLRDMRET